LLRSKTSIGQGCGRRERDPAFVAQDFTADGPDRKSGPDISYIWTAEGWLYLTVVLDLFSRRVVGWATNDR